MYRLSNNTLQKFLDCFIAEMKEENDCYKAPDYPEVNIPFEIDIPFILSSLYQSLGNDTDKYKEFVQDLEDYPDYNIIISQSKNEYNGIIDVEVNLVKENSHNNEDMYIPQSFPDYSYVLSFSIEDRDFGWCECTPDMPDYREDKHCCGHGCDASFCSFSLHKVLNIISDSWHGDEHDYWEFEDGFYASDKELADKKKEEDRVREIEELKNRINTDSKRLAELTGNK